MKLPWLYLQQYDKKHELLILCEHLSSPLVFGGARVAHHFGFVLCILLCLSSSCVFCTKCWHCLWIVHFLLPLRFSLTFIYYLLSKLFLFKNWMHFLFFYWRVKAWTEAHSAFHTKHVPRSTLLQSNKTTKKCIQFL